MKRHQSLCLLALGATFFSISGFAQQKQDKQTLEQRVEILEHELEETRGTLAALLESAEEGTAEIDAITKYLQDQAVAATAMANTLSASESQGFTKGINFGSRETLLAGWRSQLASAQKGVPGAKPAPAEEKKPRGSGRR